MRRSICTVLAATFITLTGCASDIQGEDEALTFRQDDLIFDDLRIYPSPTTGGDGSSATRRRNTTPFSDSG